MNQVKKSSYQWAALGDINAFFGLTLDNIAGLVLIVGILFQFGVPVDFVLRNMIPGTAIGVVVGDLIFFLMAVWLARRTHHASVTAMPLGLDTPSIFGIGIFVLGPAFVHAKNNLQMDTSQAATYMWHIGICCMFLSGLFKLVCALGAKAVRDCFPRAGLLGSLAAIALVIISFLPLLDVMHDPIVGLVALAIVLVSLIGRIPLPGKIPGVVGALIIGGSIHFIQVWLKTTSVEVPFDAQSSMFSMDWLQVFQLEWVSLMSDALKYLPIVIPFALATVIGGIDCAESASAAGDHYPTGAVVGVEAIATIIASVCGGVIQTTPYIGHPAYKAMGARAAYTLSTAIFFGAAGLMGFFGYFYQYVPAAAVYPILIFVGLEISAQSFLATPKRHYPAVALACVPALAFLSINFANQILADESVRTAVIQVATNSPLDTNANAPMTVQLETLANPKLKEHLKTANTLASGFILTSLFWASGLALAIDRRLIASAACFAACCIMTLFGLIHSPMPGGSMFLPFAIAGIDPSWSLPSVHHRVVFTYAIAYFATALVLAAWAAFLNTIQDKGEEPTI